VGSELPGDGSLADRFSNLDPRTHVYAKTGSLGGVKALSGYATTARGQQVAFSILSNNFNLPSKRVLEAIDSIVEVIVNDTKK
jgi:D-alanyl-D-alanine carboxypeptidase/D-alanyl-D-alanine-endopeptidase (penicillin-binding protein 4)